MMNNGHVYKPKIINSCFRILPKYQQRFIKTLFNNFRTALNYGLENYKIGFRVFQQNCYEYHEPDNIQLAKIENIGEV